MASKNDEIRGDAYKIMTDLREDMACGRITVAEMLAFQQR